MSTIIVFFSIRKATKMNVEKKSKEKKFHQLHKIECIGSLSGILLKVKYGFSRFNCYKAVFAWLLSICVKWQFKLNLGRIFTSFYSLVNCQKYLFNKVDFGQLNLK